MGRSGYVEDFEDEDESGACNLYRGSVERALRGRRGQAFLREMAAALDAMPVKELIANDLVCEDGRVCAMGAVAVARKLDVSKIDETEPEDVAAVFGIARSMACEIAFINDDDFGWKRETSAERFVRVRAWVAALINEVPVA